MCGRAAQTRRAVREAENLLLGASSIATTTTAAAASRTCHQREAGQEQAEYEWQDNYNMSPGMSCTVFYRNDDNIVQMDRKIWGLVKKGGTPQTPLPSGMTLHFQNSMFNARSDTLLDKRSFAPLFQNGRTCIIVVDGFFEWKPPTLKGTKKQPYYVYRNKNASRQCLMFAGLWNSVATGRESDSSLDTFTIITTEACPALKWLHSRMPLTIYNEKLAGLWLQKPSRDVFKQIDEAVTPPDYFQWHQVTTEMNSIKFRGQDAIKAIPPPASVKSFFSTLEKGEKASISAPKEKSSLQSPLKRRAQSTSPSPPAKKAARQVVCRAVKKGPIESFFSPKPKK